MAVRTGTELKKDLRRDVVDQVVHLNSQQGLAGSRVWSQPFLVLDHPAEGALHHAHVTMERTENWFQPENVIQNLVSSLSIIVLSMVGCDISRYIMPKTPFYTPVIKFNKLFLSYQPIKHPRH